VLITETNLPAGSLQFSSSTYSVSESAHMANITVTRTGGNGGIVGVTWSTGGGTATPNLDYAPASGTLTWAHGEMGSKTFSVWILDDILMESGETVGLTLSNPTGGATLGSPMTASLTITDDDPPMIVFGQPQRLQNGWLQVPVMSSVPMLRIQTSTNLTDWAELATVPNSSGYLELLDSSAAAFPKRFYRGVWP
jgi:hypothetical protein